MLLAFAACSTLEDIPTPVPPTVEEEEGQPSGQQYTITLMATKSEAETKALDLSSDGKTLNAYWASTEKVKVYSGGSLIGTLNVTPDAGEKPATATLSGNISISGIAPGDGLTLLIPREIWGYTGQDGTIAGIEASYSYALASVTIGTVNSQDCTVTATGAADFQNRQSVYRLGFQDGGNYIDPQTFTVSASSGSMVQSVSWDGSAWAPLFGNVDVNAGSAPADHFYYVALRNDSTADDTYGFMITTFDHKFYIATKAIPARVLDVPGKFISAKNIGATQSSFSAESGTTDTAL